MNYGYNTAMYKSFHEEMYRDQGDAEVTSHTFTEVCDCVVNVTVWNDINSLKETRTVVVQDPIQDITMTVGTPLAVEEGSTTTQATFTFTKLSTSTPVPTSPQYVIYSGNAGNVSLMDNLTGLSADGDTVEIHFDYEIGHYCPVANLSNLVSFLIFNEESHCIDVYQRIEGPQVQASALLGTSHETVITVTTTLRWGTEFNIFLDWKDGSNETESYNSHTDTMVKTHVYTTPGSYLIAITPTNPITPYGTPVSIAQDVVIENKIVPENTSLDGVGITQIGASNGYSEGYILRLILEPGILNFFL